MLSDAGTRANDNRINNSASITLRGGSITLTGRDLWNTVETLGDLAFTLGNNNLRADAGANGTVRSAELVFGNVSQSNQAVLNVNTANGQMGSASRIVWANGASHLVNGIIPWATREAATS